MRLDFTGTTPADARAHSQTTAPAAKTQRRAILISDILGLLVLLYIAYVDLAKFDLDWDTLVYHMPFAALRMGMIRPQQFVLPPGLQRYYDGFPQLTDYVQGFLWMITRRPEAVSLISAIAPAVLALYMRIAYRLPMIWTVLIFVAVPILHVNLDSGLVDLWTNAFFTMFLFAAWRVLTQPTPSWVDALAANLALAVVVNSKEQFYVVGGFAYAVTLALAAGRMLAHWRRGSGLNWAPPAVFLVMAPITFYAPLRDLLLFHNPIFPAPIRASGFAAQRSIWDVPTALQNVAQPIRYLLSQLDLNATDMRPNGYSVGQGDVPSGSPGDHMGGSLSILLLGFIVLLGRLLAGNPPRRDQLPVIFGAALLLGVVASFPGRNELRYFSFVEITLILAVLCLLGSGTETGDTYLDGLRFAARTLLVCGAIYTSFITGFTHLWAPRIDHTNMIMDQFGVTAELDSALRQSHVICYDRVDQLAFLYAPIFHRNESAGPYVVVDYWTGHPACPTGSAILRQR
jgi:hypothetical protein